jgi:hypothetical protein
LVCKSWITFAFKAAAHVFTHVAVRLNITRIWGATVNDFILYASIAVKVITVVTLAHCLTLLNLALISISTWVPVWAWVWDARVVFYVYNAVISVWFVSFITFVAQFSSVAFHAGAYCFVSNCFTFGRVYTRVWIAWVTGYSRLTIVADVALSAPVAAVSCPSFIAVTDKTRTFLAACSMVAAGVGLAVASQDTFSPIQHISFITLVAVIANVALGAPVAFISCPPLMAVADKSRAVFATRPMVAAGVGFTTTSQHAPDSV